MNLTRKAGEEICIIVEGRIIGTITVISWDRGKHRLGFTFDPDVKILRKELLNRPDNDPEPDPFLPPKGE